MIAIIDYGMGNLRSVQKAFERLGVEATVTSDKALVESADKLVLPGVGAIADAIAELKRADLVDPIVRAVESNRPFLGICLGFQALFERSEENGGTECLGLFKGRAHATNERTVVRPTYSYFGDYILAEGVIGDICRIAAEDDPAINSVVLVTQNPSPEDYIINVAVKINSGCSLWDDVMKYQQKVNDAVEYMTAFNVAEVNIEVRGIENDKYSHIL